MGEIAIELYIQENEDEVTEFLRLCSIIETLGRKGVTTSVPLTVDGESGKRLRFGMLYKENPIPLPKAGDIDINNFKRVTLGR